VERDIRPEPTDLERAAIDRALEQVDSGDRIPAAYRSPWRLAGLVEVTQQDDDGP
jgi:hypothetical protein